MSDKESVLNKLREVIDPELGINVVELGLIYGIEPKRDEVRITMTLTSPGCPLAEVIDQEVRDKMKELGISKVDLEIVFEPLWTMEKMSEEAKAQLGFTG